MPSSRHQAFVELFRYRPELVAELLTNAVGMDLPPYQQARLDSDDSIDLTPTEYRADAVGVFAVEGGPVLAAVVLGPDRVPVITDADQAKHSPELAVLSAMAHSTHPNFEDVAKAFLSAIDVVDEERATLYSDVVYAALPAAARKILEAVVSTRTYEYQSELVRRYVLQGRAEGRIEAMAGDVLKVLDARSIPVSDEARARITACTDLDQLDTWVRRAASVDSVDDLLT